MAKIKRLSLKNPSEKASWIHSIHGKKLYRKTIEKKVEACLKQFGRNDEQRVTGTSLRLWFQNICSQFMVPEDLESCHIFQIENGAYFLALKELRDQYPSVFKFSQRVKKYWNIMLDCINSAPNNSVSQK